MLLGNHVVPPFHLPISLPYPFKLLSSPPQLTHTHTISRHQFLLNPSVNSRRHLLSHFLTNSLPRSLPLPTLSPCFSSSLSCLFSFSSFYHAHILPPLSHPLYFPPPKQSNCSSPPINIFSDEEGDMVSYWAPGLLEEPDRKILEGSVIILIRSCKRRITLVWLAYRVPCTGKTSCASQ